MFEEHHTHMVTTKALDKEGVVTTWDMMIIFHLTSNFPPFV